MSRGKELKDFNSIKQEAIRFYQVLLGINATHQVWFKSPSGTYQIINAPLPRMQLVELCLKKNRMVSNFR